MTVILWVVGYLTAAVLLALALGRAARLMNPHVEATVPTDEELSVFLAAASADRARGLL